MIFMKKGKQGILVVKLLIVLFVIVSVAAFINIVFAADVAPPGRLNPSPPNNSYTDNSITLGLDTNETAGCRYSTSSGQGFSDMTVFTNTNASTHTSSITLTEYASYNYYVKCTDSSDNVNTDDFLIQFSYLPNYTTYGNTIEMNLVFHIGSGKADDVIYGANNYVAAAGDNVVLGFASSGLSLDSNFSKNHSAANYLITLKQSQEDNLFLLAFTDGNQNTIKGKLGQLGDKKVLPKTFGSLSMPEALSYPIFVRLDYDDADIDSRVGWSGSGQVRIRNRGKTSTGLPNITIEVVD